jgi:hypothetical protein
MVNNKIANLTVLNLTIARHELELNTTMRTRGNQNPSPGLYNPSRSFGTGRRIEIKKKKTGKKVIFYLKNLKICRIVHFSTSSIDSFVVTFLLMTWTWVIPLK